MSDVENFLLSLVFQREDLSVDYAVPSHKRVIRISHCIMTGTCRGFSAADITYHDIVTLADHQVIVPVPDFLVLSKRPQYTERMAEILTRLRVPKFEQPAIIEKMFVVVELAENPQWPIACMIMDVTLFHQTTGIDMAALLESFEKVSIDSVGDGVRETECVICKESLDHSVGVAQGIDGGQLIRLPCSHVFHHDCILRWISMKQLCPLCRYSLPDVEQAMPVVEEAAEPSWW